MKINYKINYDDKRVTVNVSGRQDFDEYIVFYNELMAEIKEKDIISILWDARELDMRNTTTDQIEKGIELLNSWSPIRKGGKAACVVNDAFSYGIGRMFQNMAEAKNIFEQKINIEIFKDYKEAEEWIGE